MSLTYQPIEKYLTKGQLTTLRAGFAKGPAPDLSGPLTTVYPGSQEFVHAIVRFAALGKPDSGPQERAVLSAQDRERCIIALLCSRREDVELAIHIYLALMAGVSIPEIASIMLLAGMYTGVDNLTRGLLVYTTTLQTLQRQTDPTPQGVVDAIIATFHRSMPACGTRGSSRSGSPAPQSRRTRPEEAGRSGIASWRGRR